MSCIFAFCGVFGVKVSGKYSFLLWPLAAVVFSAFDIALVQIANEYGPILPVMQYLIGIEVSVAIMLLFFCIYVWFIKDLSQSAKAAIITSSVLFLVLGIVNFYTFGLRGKGISPEDFWSIRTAANVVGEYDIEITPAIRNVIMLFMAAVLLLTGVKTSAVKVSVKQNLLSLSCAALLVFNLHFSLQITPPWYWADKGTKLNGLMLNLAGQLDQLLFNKPEVYSLESVGELEREFLKTTVDEKPEQLPHIIVIMNESWSDLRVWGEIETSVPILPFYDSATENTIKGYALASVYGGMTPDSEYEFLTGNSIAFHSPSSVPYVQYINKNTWSFVRHLEQCGYKSFYTHPCSAVNYDRDAAVPSLGFDEVVFEEDYVNSAKKRVFTSDAALYDRIIQEYEETKGDGKLFSFAVTMQNHGPYAKKEEFDEEVLLLEPDSLSERLCIEDYLTCVHESDAQFKRLTEYFESESEPVLLMMYGDHQPSVAEEYGVSIRENTGDAQEENNIKYTVPFIIWANYDIEEQYVELTSINYFSNYLFEAAGISLPPYSQFLMKAQEQIPVINAYGYYSQEKGRFANFDEAQGEEKKWLEAYEILQYNAMFDKKNRSEVFFPID